MSALIAFLGLRGTVVAGVLGAALVASVAFGGWQYVRAETEELGRQKAVTAKENIQGDLIVCTRANESAAFAEEARRKMAEANTRVYMAALDNAREAAERARRDKAEAERLIEQWRKTWGDRTANCAAALQTLDTACPELERY